MEKIRKETPILPVEPKRLDRINRFNRPTIDSSNDVYDLIDNAKKSLKRVGLKSYAKEMEDRCLESGDYDEVLEILAEYVIIDD